jgi:replicative DNA helicase
MDVPPVGTMGLHMKHLGDLLAPLPLPPAEGADGVAGCDPDLIHDLGADLPAGHLQLWAGPRGAGKTAFLLSLLHGAAARGRRVAFATYHLSAASLALRMLAMAARLDAEALAAGRLPRHQLERASVVRSCLVRRPIHILEARGMSVASLGDRIVRMPFRAEVLAVDYLQAVVRPEGQDLGGALRAFASLASRLHLAVVVALEAVNERQVPVVRLADRAGWIAPAGGSGLRRAEVICNRYGARPAVGLQFEETSGSFTRLG